MIGRIEVFFRRIRRKLSRSAWLARLLQLPVSEGSPTRPGLILIQIDGLSQSQFERALKRRELPFLRRLIRREHYREHAHYSGLPATTPAVQGELFYGIKGGVPAFSFKDHETDRVIRMYEPEAAMHFEALCARDGEEALLKGGSAYSDNITGGAEESHFCPSAMGWGPALRSANPLVVITFFILNIYSFVRIGGLLVLEVGLALVDFVRGLVRGQNLLKELKFIPTRVAISILLRELCVIGGKIDISRGLPIIHINFLGYDEQAHRRGPRSLFAHWTLQGIDDAIARLWRAANRSQWRHYDLWIYSDHGQARVKTYHRMQGYDLLEAISSTFEQVKTNQATRGDQAGSEQTQRVRLLGGIRIQRLFAVLGLEDEISSARQVVSALGPLAHVYSPWKLEEEERAFVAFELAHTHKIPVVLSVAGPGELCARTLTGEFRLPRDCALLFGAQHPFLDSLGEDLVRLCEHADAGDFVLLGWREGVEPLTFAEENGAHGGLAPAETNGFALLPPDVQLPANERDYLRPLDLRQAALRHLGRTDQHSAAVRKRATATDILRIMTYNVHSCIGMDGKIDTERIARVIARARPDVVALQELDVGRERSLGVDQAQQIARYLEMEFHFHPAMHLEEERYGDAILTHLPQRVIKAGSLPGLADKPALEPRGALWVAIDLHGREVQVINTHLGLSPRERLAQIDTLLGPDWLGHEACRAPVVFCGDLNAAPSSPVYRRLAGCLKDVQAMAPGHRPRSTFSSRFPSLRLDHVFVTTDIRVNGIDIPGSELTRVASDHLPLLVELRIPPDGD
ncbi:MAG: endonuclease/exonuclease/phosphatase family protein, partial [Thiohalophilus sp.]